MYGAEGEGLGVAFPGVEGTGTGAVARAGTETPTSAHTVKETASAAPALRLAPAPFRFGCWEVENNVRPFCWTTMSWGMLRDVHTTSQWGLRADGLRLCVKHAKRAGTV